MTEAVEGTCSSCVDKMCIPGVTSLPHWPSSSVHCGRHNCLRNVDASRFSPVNTVETLDQYNIITGLGFGGGSILFFLGAAVLLARQVSHN